MFFQVIFFVLVPCFLAFYLWAKKRLNSLQSKGIPCLEPSFPLGNFDGVGTKVHIVDRQQEIYETFKGSHKIAGMYSMLRPVIIPLDLDLMKNICIRDFDNFIDRGVYFNEDSDPVSAHLFNIEGAQWRFIRNKMSPTFTTGKIKNMFHTIVGKSKELIEAIDSGKQYEIKDLCLRFTCDVIGDVAFGLDCQSLKTEKSELLVAGNKIMKPTPLEFMRFFFVNSFVDLSRKLNLRLMSADCSDFFIETVKKAIQYREENNVKRQDFLNSLIQLMKTGSIDGEKIIDDKKLTENQIIAQAFLLFFAGFETSSSTMSFTIYELAEEPEIQKKLREEIKRVLQKHDGEFTYEGIMEMTYLNQVFNESIRKNPTVGTLIRCAKEDYKVPDTPHTIPKGAGVWIPVHAVHLDPEIYPNPQKFDPERFTPEEVSKRHNFSFIPFGEGPRNCIGMRFAQVQIKYIIARLVLEYELSVNPKMKRPVEYSKNAFTPEAIGGIWVDFKKLN